MEKIGLFPLSIVVFPGASLPLHIFEPRYKKLVAQALQDNTVFGINLVDAAQLYPTGCTVHVTEVFREYPDGRMDIAITGGKRYALRTLHEGEAPYYMGMVEYVEDVQEQPNTILRELTIGLYNELIRVVYPHSYEEFLLQGETSAHASFFMAQKAGIDVLKKQQLLELQSENSRLELLHSFLEGILPDLRRKQKIQEIIMNDGYLPPSKKN